MINGSKIIVNKTVFRVQGNCTKIIAESGQTGEYMAPFNGVEHYVMLGKQVLTLRDGEFDNYKEFDFEITEEDEKAWRATAGLSVIHPKHYKSNNDVIQFCLDNDMGFVEGNVLKYVRRWKEKNGIEDLEKAKEYLTRLIQYENNREKKSNQEVSKNVAESTSIH